MGLEAVIASGVKIAKSATADLQPSVTHLAWISQDKQQKPTFDTGVTLPAIVESSRQVIRQAGGEEAFASHKLTILQPVTDNGASTRREPVDIRDKFTLADGTVLRVMRVGGLDRKSTTGPFMLEVWCG